MFFKTKPQNKDLARAVALMVGYIVGVGMFGLPFVVARSGLGLFFIFVLFFGGIQYFLHLVFANLAIATPGFHQLPGYAGIYLGRAGKYFLFVSEMCGSLGALLAYLIISGIFMRQLFYPFLGYPEFFYSTILFLVGAYALYGGVRLLAKFEFWLSALLVAAIAFIAVRSLPMIDFGNYQSLGQGNWFLLYGVMLMALNGSGAVPIIVKLLKKDPVQVRRAISRGTMLAVMITIVFVLVIIGLSGQKTTPDALSGIRSVVSQEVLYFSLIFGLLSMATSYFLVAENVKEVLCWDFRLNKILAWLIAAGLPYFLFVLGANDLVRVIGFAGGVAGSLSSIVLILVFRQLVKKRHHLPLFKADPPATLLFFLIGLFILGAIYEITRL